MPRNKRAKKALKDQPAEQGSEQAQDNSSTELQTTDKSSSFDNPFPAEVHERFQLPPKQFIEAQNQVEEQIAQQRKRMVYADSIESAVGYNSLIRLLGHHFIKQVTYYRSKEGGSLSLDEARAAAYRKCENEEQANELFDELMSISLDRIGFADLSELNSFQGRWRKMFGK